jgi:hypothetical protein
MYSHEIDQLNLLDYRTMNRVGICVVALNGEVHVVRMWLNVGVASPIRATADVCNPPTIVSMTLCLLTLCSCIVNAASSSVVLHVIITSCNSKG